MVHLSSSSRQTPRQRLPELSDVLMRKTRAPLDLYCFYIFLQQENAEDALDFWLDVQQHENLCRAYFKDLKRTDRTVVDDWPEFYDYARRYGSVFSSVAGVVEHTTSEQHDQSRRHWREKGGLGETEEKHYSHAEQHSEDVHEEEYDGTRSPSFRARRDTESHQPRTPTNVNMGNDQQQNSLSANASPLLSDGEHVVMNHASSRPPTANSIGKGHPPGDARGPSRASFVDSFFGATSDSRNPSQSHNMTGNEHGEFPNSSGGGTFSGLRSTSRRVSRAPTVISRKQAITQQDLVASGERIYLRYLLPGAEKEIYLPPPIRIHDFPSSPDNDEPSDPSADPRIPDYFHVAKEYIFKALEDDAFVRFIRAKAFCNLTRLGTFIRLFCGLFCLWAGFVVAFTLVFYDYKPKIRRLYLIIPFFLAFYFVISACYALDPFLVLVNKSETHPFQTIKMGERSVKKILRGRAALVMVWVVLLTAVMAAVWWAVPGHRL